MVVIEGVPYKTSSNKLRKTKSSSTKKESEGKLTSFSKTRKTGKLQLSLITVPMNTLSGFEYYLIIAYILQLYQLLNLTLSVVKIYQWDTTMIDVF